jgi:hypothetical protein
MKAAWTAISVLAIANLLAIGGFFLWLKNSDRINVERVHAVRALFSQTIAQENAVKADAAAKVEDEKKKADADAKAAKPPLTATEQLAAKLQASEQDRQKVERLRREVDDLKKSLVQEREDLNAARVALDTERKAFAAMREKIASDEGNAQFKKTLSVLDNVKPQVAALMLTEQMAASKDGVDLVVSYLNALDESKRAKIVTEFAKTDPKMAADLLERLRTRGIVARKPEEPVK